MNKQRVAARLTEWTLYLLYFVVATPIVALVLRISVWLLTGRWEFGGC